MKHKYMAFDIETVTPFPEGEDWRDHTPLGIGCAAACALDGKYPEPMAWYGSLVNGAIPMQMSPQELRQMVEDLTDLTREGYTLLTWNGMGFDFDVLARESGSFEQCKELALNHVDMMFHLFAVKGYPLALSTAAHGMGTEDKTEGMDGAKATQMWADHENRQAVLDYCKQDTRSTLDLALACETNRNLTWTSRSGRRQVLTLRGGWATVREAMLMPAPDTSWMDNPIPRTQFTGWLQENGPRN